MASCGGGFRQHERLVDSCAAFARECVRDIGNPHRDSSDSDLDKELRFHLVEELHHFVAGLLTDAPIADLRQLAGKLNREGFHLRLTRDLDAGKQYLRDRYAGDRQALFGLIASSKDKSLPAFGIPNDFQSTKRVKVRSVV